MASINSYTFNNIGRIGNDNTDQTQRNISNTQYSNYLLSNFSSNNTSDQHVNFAVKQHMTSFNGLANGNGINGTSVEKENKLLYTTVQERSLEKLQLFERPFKTVPYLGRGSSDPVIESQLQQGEFIGDKKSVSTIMEKSFTDYSLYPTDNNMKEFVSNPANTVEEAALSSWIRGGINSRFTNNE